MKLAVTAIVAVAASAIGALDFASRSAAGAEPSGLAPLRENTGAGRVPGEYIVQVEATASVNSFDSALAAATNNGGTVLAQFDTVLSGYAARLDSTALEAVRSNPNVEVVTPNRRYQGGGDVQPNPEWHLDRIDQPNLPLDDAYHYNSTGQGVNAYVIDSGVRATHRDFSGRAEGVFTSINDGNGTNDCAGHGTFVASELGGETYGVAKDVNVKAVRVLGCDNSGTTASIVAGMDWVAKNHQEPSIANTSIQSYYGFPDRAMDRAAAGLIDSGVVLVTIVGNFNSPTCMTSPKDPRAIAAAASTRDDERNTGRNPSSYGSCVTVFAPGADVTAAGIDSDSDVQPGFSGTSMAAPLIAGTVARMLQSNPSLTMAEAKQRIVDNSSKGVLSNVGWGSPNRLLNSNID